MTVFRVLAEHDVWKGPRMNMALDWKGQILTKKPLAKNPDFCKRSLIKKDNGKGFLTEKHIGERSPLTEKISGQDPGRRKDPWKKIPD
jgi:hypothetical protein